MGREASCRKNKSRLTKICGATRRKQKWLATLESFQKLTCDHRISEKIQKKDRRSGHFGKFPKVDMRSKNQNPPHPLRTHALNEKKPSGDF
jgi:hypothetical protein